MAERSCSIFFLCLACFPSVMSLRFIPIVTNDSISILLKDEWYSVVFISSVQSLSHIWHFVTPWTAARQASLSITNSQSPPKPTSIESVMPSNHLILCRPLLLLPSIFPGIRVFSNESALCIRWPKYWIFSFNISPSNEHPGLIFSSGHVWMWELDYKESWMQKNWCFWTVVLEKTLESPLDCREIQQVHPKGDQLYTYTTMISLSIPLSADTLSCFHILAIVNKAEANLRSQVSLQSTAFIFFECIHRVGFVGSSNMVVLFLDFWEVFILFSIMVIPIYIPTNSAQVHFSLYILTICYLLLF